jgi:hypothetical protein
MHPAGGERSFGRSAGVVQPADVDVPFDAIEFDVAALWAR